MIETILFLLFTILVLAIHSINSTPNYKYELLGTFIHHYTCFWDKDGGYRTKIVAIFEDKENNSRKYEGSLVHAHEWLKSWERHNITTEQLIDFLKNYGTEFIASQSID